LFEYQRKNITQHINLINQVDMFVLPVGH
jgi:hypothetical protein